MQTIDKNQLEHKTHYFYFQRLCRSNTTNLTFLDFVCWVLSECQHARRECTITNLLVNKFKQINCILSRSKIRTQVKEQRHNARARRPTKKRNKIKRPSDLNLSFRTRQKKIGDKSDKYVLYVCRSNMTN